MNLSDIPVTELLPQRPPFLLVDNLLEYEDPVTVTSFTVREGGVFVVDGEMLSAGLMENMAQSSALRIGYINKYIRHCAVKIGYIGNVRNFKVLRTPKVGETLRTKITTVSEVFGITLVNAEIWCGDEMIASASLKTAEVDKEAE
ncbi:MAG: pseudouridylate synthase [Bacteroidales bacterium]|nr:pseudouridylate synthase [Bacteroidales bacterium]